jgi:NADPH-dependent 2,4-dienoyl-CoA reductase/sulfur reductase-like enzyme
MAEDAIDFLLLGGGLASVTAAEVLRAEGAAGSIAILSADPALPYQRPPLSKQYLLRDMAPERILIQPENFYRDKRIDLRLGVRAAAVQPKDHLVLTDGGAPIRYGKLLIATGGRANGFDVPGAALAGVQRLRTQGDADAIRRAAAAAKRAVVVGGSFLGLEVAAALVRLGLAVTIIDRGSAIMPMLHAARLSEFFATYAARARARIAWALRLPRRGGAFPATWSCSASVSRPRPTSSTGAASRSMTALSSTSGCARATRIFTRRAMSPISSIPCSRGAAGSSIGTMR